MHAPSSEFGAASRAPSPKGFGSLVQMRGAPVLETLKGVASSDAYARYMKNDSTMPNVYDKQDLSRANQLLVFYNLMSTEVERSTLRAPSTEEGERTRLSGVD